MSSDWAAKLANVSTSKSTTISPSTSNADKKPIPKKKQSPPPSNSSSNRPTPEVETQTQFNSSEILEYLNSNHVKYLQLAKQDKEEEEIKIYRSLESSSQWTTTVKPISSQNSGKYNAKDVIRNKNGSNNTLDLIFEINRSIYQQKEAR